MSPKDAKDEKTLKINKWDGSAVKNAIDDAVKEVFTSKLKCKEDFLLIDIRLIICGVAVGIAGFALIWDYLYPFPQSRSILIFSVTSYFILMGILTLYTTYVEKGIFAVAHQQGSDKKAPLNALEASSHMKKHDDSYSLTVALISKANKTRLEKTVTKSCAAFIDADGVVVEDAVEATVEKLHKSLLSEYASKGKATKSD